MMIICVFSDDFSRHFVARIDDFISRTCFTWNMGNKQIKIWWDGQLPVNTIIVILCNTNTMLEFYVMLIISIIIQKFRWNSTPFSLLFVAVRERNPYEGFALNILTLCGFLRNEVCEKRDHGTIVPCTGARAFLKRKPDRRRLVAVRRVPSWVKHTKTAIEKSLALANVIVKRSETCVRSYYTRHYRTGDFLTLTEH